MKGRGLERFRLRPCKCCFSVAFMYGILFSCVFSSFNKEFVLLWELFSVFNILSAEDLFCCVCFLLVFVVRNTNKRMSTQFTILPFLIKKILLTQFDA